MTVTYYRSYDKDLFVQDGNDAIYVHATTSLKLTPGDRILLRGTTHESFRPYVITSDITVIGHGPLPKPAEPTFDQMIRAEEDCKLVTVRALIRSADLVPDSRSMTPSTALRMLVDGGTVDANVDNEDENALNNLLDAEVEITGAVSGHFDNKMQLTGVLLHVPSLAGIKILKSAPNRPLVAADYAHGPRHHGLSCARSLSADARSRNSDLLPAGHGTGAAGRAQKPVDQHR